MVSQQPSQRNDEEQASWDIDEQEIGQWGFRNDIEVPNRHKTVNYIKERFERSRYNPTTWLLLLLLALPLAWVSHFLGWHHNITFSLCFIAMIPLQKIFDWGGEELGAYLEQDLKDLVVITLSNAIEAALALILLVKCELRLLQSTIIGVVLLHLLLVPGAAFCAGGSRMHEQKLDPTHNSLNHSLSMAGVLGILIPTIFFAALDRGDVTNPTAGGGLPQNFVPLVSDRVRAYILQISRGIAIVLPAIYVVSRLWRHRIIARHRPGEGLHMRDQSSDIANHEPSTSVTHDCMNATLDAGYTLQDPPTSAASTLPDVILDHTENTITSLLVYNTGSPDPIESLLPEAQVNWWFCLLSIFVAVGFMIPTAEFLVSSIEEVQDSSGIQIEWFGLILLPILSFSGDGIAVICKFSYRCWKRWQLRKTNRTQHSRPSGWMSMNLTYRFKDDCSQASGFWMALPPDQAGSHTSQALRGETDLLQWRPVDLGIRCRFPSPSPSSRPRPSTSSDQSASEHDDELAHWRPIDLSIQFMLWWTPFLVLLGWWTDRPMHLLFDYYEVGLLVGACFLVNYVTVDGKTNFSEGFTMISFYVIIATATWFYPGQPQVGFMLSCPGTVAEAVAAGIEPT